MQPRHEQLQLSNERHRKAIADRLHELGLEAQRTQLDELGYAIVPSVLSADETDALRTAALESLHAGNGAQAAMLLKRGEIFERLVCHPVFIAIAESMVGKGCLLSQLTALRKCAVGSGGFELPIGLHSDLVGFREPFSPYPWLITIVVALDDWSAGAGGSTVLPGSHKLQAHPAARVASAPGLVTLEMPSGSIAVWNGALHHGNSPRTIPGDRVTLHITYSRSLLRTWEDYGDIARRLERDGQLDSTLASLLGANDPFGKNTERGANREKIAKLAQWFRT
jgi:hypothetical protein